jgi:hypothetical protein
MSAHSRLIAKAPAPASDKGTYAGGIGATNFLPRHPKRSETGYEQDPGKGHAYASPAGCAPTKRYGD